MRHCQVERHTRNHRHHRRHRQRNPRVLPPVQRRHKLRHNTHREHRQGGRHMGGPARLNQPNTRRVRHCCDHPAPHARHRGRREQHRKARRSNPRRNHLQQQVQTIRDVWPGVLRQRQMKQGSQHPHGKRCAHQKHRHIHEPRHTRQKIHPRNIQHTRDHREPRHQEQYRRNEPHHVFRTNQLQPRQQINQPNIGARRQEPARHPDRHMAHPALHEGGTQKLPQPGGNKNRRTLNQPATVQKREPRARHRRSQSKHPPFIQVRHRINAFQFGIRLLRGDPLRQFRNEIAQQINLVRVNAHRALLGHLGAKIPVPVGGGGDLSERHLGVVLIQAHRLRQARH